MYEVILYAAIATIVCAVLYSVLGKSVGQGPEDGIDATKLMSANDSNISKIVPPVIDDRGMPGLGAIGAADPEFTEQKFLMGAKAAYSMILDGFANGDREELKMLLTPDVYSVYEAAITDRESQSLTQVTDLGRLISADIIGAKKDGKIGTLNVRFEAELTSALVDADGRVVEGDPDILSTISEVWTFERDMSGNSPNWLLSDVAPSEGDTLEADPTPDTRSE